jgi:hypothetical protein
LTATGRPQWEAGSKGSDRQRGQGAAEESEAQPGPYEEESDDNSSQLDWPHTFEVSVDDPLVGSLAERPALGAGSVLAHRWSHAHARPPKGQRRINEKTP